MVNRPFLTSTHGERTVTCSRLVWNLASESFLAVNDPSNSNASGTMNTGLSTSRFETNETWIGLSWHSGNLLKASSARCWNIFLERNSNFVIVDASRMIWFQSKLHHDTEPGLRPDDFTT
jgi:hypothetical protein